MPSEQKKFVLEETLTQRGITPVIPPKANRNIKRECELRTLL